VTVNQETDGVIWHS